MEFLFEYQNQGHDEVSHNNDRQPWRRIVGTEMPVSFLARRAGGYDFQIAMQELALTTARTSPRHTP